jgi:UPF0755 protein
VSAHDPFDGGWGRHGREVEAGRGRLSVGSRRFLAALAVLVVLAAVSAVVLPRILAASGPEAGLPVTYEVPKGASVRAVGEDLEALGVIDSALRFRLVADREGLASVLRPGRFELVTGMDIEAAIALLAAGPVEAELAAGIRFTVREGLTVAETLAELDAAFEDLTADDFRAVLDARLAGPGDGLLVLPAWAPEPGDPPAGVVEPYEGLLWPQTYEVIAGAGAQLVMQTMLDQLDREMAEVLASAPADVDPWRLLTVASLIERETRVDGERPIVAGVIANRLRDGMRLEIDATLSYAKGDLTAVPLDADRDIDSPYNTYRVAGMPPGPISGVGRASLAAAAAPAATDAYFYVLDPACDGTHRFAATFAEHQRNVVAFRAARDAGACAP